MVILRTLCASALVVAAACGHDASSTSSQGSVPATSAPTAGAAAVASTKPASPKAAHPCTLLTNADAEAVIGKLKRPAPLEDVIAGSHFCAWESDWGISLFTADTPEGLAYVRETYGGRHTQDVPGVGDKAGWVEAGHYILVESGANTFAFAIGGPGGTVENAKALSLKVIANL